MKKMGCVAGPWALVDAASSGHLPSCPCLPTFDTLKSTKCVSLVHMYRLLEPARDGLLHRERRLCPRAKTNSTRLYRLEMHFYRPRRSPFSIERG